MAFLSLCCATYGRACIISHVGLAVYSTVSFLFVASFGKMLSISMFFSALSRKVKGTVFVTLSASGRTGR